MSASWERYFAINRANWDARAPIHAANYGVDELLADPAALSAVVRFDLARLGDIAGLNVVHLQCHIGTDTLSLARLGATLTGVDQSGLSLREARGLAARAGIDIEFVQADVYSAPTALAGRRFDLVYTGVGAICWLPNIRRWAETVAALLRPGGRLFIRDAHPVLNSLLSVTVGNASADRDQQPFVSGPGELTPALELAYFEQPEPIVWVNENTYAGTTKLDSPQSVEWNHGLGEVVTAVMAVGMELTSLVEHDSVPWDALPGLMVLNGHTGEYRLRERPERLPASFTLIARRR